MSAAPPPGTPPISTGAAATDLPPLADVLAASEGTWPPARAWRLGAVTLRDGAGGGKRVRAATVEGAPQAQDLDGAEAAMRQAGEAPLFMVRPGEEALDAALAARGYRVIDPVTIWAASLETLCAERPPRVTVFHIWPPLALQRDIWRGGGIGPERVAVMARAKGPKAALLTRWNDHPGGAGFVAIHGDIAMVHAVEILPHQRRQGAGRAMMRGAAHWAAEEGARYMAVLCTRENRGANGLYASLGMQAVGQYHYRIKEEASPRD